MAMKIAVDNWWAVLHSPDLLRKFGSRENVELPISKVGSIKYLFKYVWKVHDRITVEIVGGFTADMVGKTAECVPIIDEIRHYQDARYIYIGFRSSVETVLILHSVT